MTLKAAILRARVCADFAPIKDWSKNFAESLEASGFVIVPKEATEVMLRSLSDGPSYPYVVSEKGMKSRQAIYKAQLSARPRLDNE